MKSVRLSGLAASTALALILALSSQYGQAQSAGDGPAQAATSAPDTATQANKPPALSEKQIEAAVPMPDTSLPPPPTAKDVAQTAPDALPKSAMPAPDAAAPATKDAQAQPAKQPPAAAASAPAPAATADNAVTDALKNLIAGRVDRFVPRKDDRAGVEAFYKKRDYKPLWVSNGAADARTKAAIAYLASVAADGLDPSDYPTPEFKASASPAELAADELKLTNAVLIYAHDAQVGRINFTRVGSDISFKLEAPEPAAVLANVADAKDVAAALDGYNPPQAGFKALKAKLAELRKQGDAPAKPAQEKKQVHVDAGPILRPGMRDRRVVQLRKRLDIGDSNNPLYDETVLEAVKAFQTQADIGADGMLGPNTLRALNGERTVEHRPQNRIDTVIVNMERWRWLPRKLGNAQNTYVVVNVPDFSLKLMHDGKVYWKTIIVAGKPDKATPMTSAEMKYITVNPTWNVPPSIIENEYLPALQQDPEALDRIGLKIRQDPDGTVHIFQPPGAGNALGRIRFNFPNKFLVYQHDTPDKYLFKRAKRAYSHGCMRVQDPLEYATKLLSIELPQQHYTPAKIEGMFGGSEININFPRPIPVHLTYQTAFVDQQDHLQFRDDVYGRDARMIAILKNAHERRIAYIPVERPPNTSARPVRLPVGSLAGDGGYVGDGYRYGGGSNFFDWLFGGGREPAAQYYRPPRRHIGPRAGDEGLFSRR